MITQRIFTNFTFVATLVAAAGFAVLSPHDAEAGGKHDFKDAFSCDSIDQGKKLDAGARGRLQAACKKGGIKTYGDMKDMMVDWKKAAKKAGMKKDCKDCHNDNKGLDGTKPEGYKGLAEFMDKAGVK